MILRNHGFVACGRTVEDALHLAFHTYILLLFRVRHFQIVGPGIRVIFLYTGPAGGFCVKPQKHHKTGFYHQNTRFSSHRALNPGPSPLSNSTFIIKY